MLSHLTERTGSSQLTTGLIEGESAIGGGCGPDVHPTSVLISLKHSSLSADEIEQKLRLSSPPVIARIAEGLVLLDLRTVDETDEPELLQALQSLAG